MCSTGNQRRVLAIARLDHLSLRQCHIRIILHCSDEPCTAITESPHISIQSPFNKLERSARCANSLAIGISQTEPTLIHRQHLDLLLRTRTARRQFRTILDPMAGLVTPMTGILGRGRSGFRALFWAVSDVVLYEVVCCQYLSERLERRASTHSRLITDLTDIFPPHSFPIPLPIFPVMTPLHAPGIVERVRAYHIRPSRRSGG